MQQINPNEALEMALFLFWYLCVPCVVLIALGWLFEHRLSGLLQVLKSVITFIRKTWKKLIMLMTKTAKAMR